MYKVGANSVQLGFRVRRECQEMGQELLRALNVMLSLHHSAEGVGDRRLQKVSVVRLV